MSTKKRQELIEDVVKVALATLAATAGALTRSFAGPVAGVAVNVSSSTLLGRWFERFEFGASANSFIDKSREELAVLAEGESDDVVAQAFATAQAALQYAGLSARSLARLDFNATKAADHVADVCQWHGLVKGNGGDGGPLAYRCLKTLYACFLSDEPNIAALELAFQQELLERTRDLGALSNELRELVDSLSWMNLLEMPAGNVPPYAAASYALKAQYELLPYQPRDEDPALSDWFESPAEIGIVVIRAGGGSGKTRWLLEHCRRLAAKDWRSGFLRSTDAGLTNAAYAQLVHSAQPLVIVVDYVEDRAEQLVRLLEAAARALASGTAHQPRKLRLVLLTRNLTETWWDNLRRMLSSDAQALIGTGSRVVEQIELAPLSGMTTDRETLFDRAVNALRPFVDTPHTISAPPDLTPNFFANPLFIQLAALSLLSGGDVPMNEHALLEVTLDHEARYLVGAKADSDLAPMEAILAVITLWQGVSSGSVTDIIAAWPNPDSPVRAMRPAIAAERLQRLYPRPESGIAPLAPDRLGEALILRSLARDPDLIPAAFGPDTKDADLKAGFDVITRMPASAQDRLTTIGGTLAALIAQRNDPAFARRVMAQLPKYSVSLVEVDEAAARMVLNDLESNPRDDDGYRAERAFACDYHSATLARIDHREAALKAGQEAVDLRRQLAAQRPDAFNPDLAASLSNLGVYLSDLGDREAALEATEEAVTLYRQLAAQRPDAFNPDLAKTLSVMSVLLMHDEATQNQAVACLSEGIERLTPSCVCLPSAFSSLMEALVNRYLEDCALANQVPDERLLQPVRANCPGILGRHEDEGRPSDGSAA